MSSPFASGVRVVSDCGTVEHNALRVLGTMGILDDVEKAAQGPRLPHFSFVHGADPRDLVYQVSFTVQSFVREAPLNASMQYPESAPEKNQGLGIHR